MNAPVNDLPLIERLQQNPELPKEIRLRQMLRNPRHPTPEMATINAFSDLTNNELKKDLLIYMTSEHGPHLIKKPSGAHKKLLSCFFASVGICDAFSSIPVAQWSENSISCSAASQF